MKYKGIILAGGMGTRLYPMTQLYSKHLISIYDKPMIYYPLSFLMMLDIRDILVIADFDTSFYYRDLFENGEDLGLSITYKIQNKPKGIAEALIIGEEFIDDNVILILGDNIFYGETTDFKHAIIEHSKATIFAYYVNNPTEYGVVDFKDEKVISLEEKPKIPKSNYAVPGLYIYNKCVIDIVKNLKPSNRGELEITDVNKNFMEHNELKVQKLGRGIAWFDTGSPQSLLEASNFIAAVENRQGLKIGCIEEIALRQGFISINKFKDVIKTIPKSQYKEYLEKLC